MSMMEIFKSWMDDDVEMIPGNYLTCVGDEKICVHVDTCAP